MGVPGAFWWISGLGKYCTGDPAYSHLPHTLETRPIHTYLTPWRPGLFTPTSRTGDPAYSHLPHTLETSWADYTTAWLILQHCRAEWPSFVQILHSQLHRNYLISNSDIVLNRHQIKCIGLFTRVTLARLDFLNCVQKLLKTLPMLSKAQDQTKLFEKKPKPCHVGIH